MQEEESKKLYKNEHIEFDGNFQKRPVEVFKWTINPFIAMSVCTILTILFYVVFMAVGLTLPITEDVHGGYPSISAIIAYSKGMTITFTFIVYIHWYCLYSYLVIISEYLGKNSFAFYTIGLLCILYVICLIVVTYLPLNVDELKHNIFAVSSFVFALLSVYLHKHSIFVYTARGYEASNKREIFLLTVELGIVILISVMGFLFWFYDNMWAEYVFVFVILIDKQIKIMILLGLRLLYLEGSYMQYSYYSPPNPLDPNFIKTDFEFT